MARTALLAYAGVALAVYPVSVSAWRTDAAILLAWGVKWWAGTRCPRLCAEYRAMARLLG